jgi:four helix bundle protein
MEDGFKSLIVWQKSMLLARETYEFTESFPQKERYGLADQMRRAAVSTPSNIAEGNRRSSRKDYAQFLHIAHGSLAELETQLLLARDLYPNITSDKLLGLAQEISRMLFVLIRRIKE